MRINKFLLFSFMWMCLGVVTLVRGYVTGYGQTVNGPQAIVFAWGCILFGALVAISQLGETVEESVIETIGSENRKGF